MEGNRLMEENRSMEETLNPKEENLNPKDFLKPAIFLLLFFVWLQNRTFILPDFCMDFCMDFFFTGM